MTEAWLRRPTREAPEDTPGVAPPPPGVSIARVTHAVIVHCPACETGYLLPRNLLGSLGARVTCPACREVFDVDARGTLVAGVPEEWPVRPFAPGAGVAEAERLVAAEVLDELGRRTGASLEWAARENRLFREHGPDLLEAFDEYRRRTGERAGAQAFREELQRRWHVELFPLAEARG